MTWYLPGRLYIIQPISKYVPRGERVYIYVRNTYIMLFVQIHLWDSFGLFHEDMKRPIANVTTNKITDLMDTLIDLMWMFSPIIKVISIWSQSGADILNARCMSSLRFHLFAKFKKGPSPLKASLLFCCLLPSS